MEKENFAEFLKKMLAEAKDASQKEQILNLLKELENSGKDPEKSPIPKNVLRKGMKIISRFFLKLAEHEVLNKILKELEDFDLDP